MAQIRHQSRLWSGRLNALNKPLQGFPMPPNNPVTRRKSLAIISGLVACAGLPQAAASERDNQRPISIAVPDFSGDLASDDASARNITEIVTSDLRASGRLALVESNGLAEENIHAVPQFDQWRGSNAEYLVTGRIIRKPDQRVLVEFRLWDVVSGKQLYAAQYLLQLDDWRRVPHAIAAAILERLIGRT
jgi:TolB protein